MRGIALTWPPPGLEAIQGRFWPLVGILALGDAILVLPLLAAVAVRQDFWSLGQFGHSWWVPVITTVVGLVILLLGFERLFRLMWLATRASRQGHGWLMILQVAADSPRDSGFVLQGARLYSVFTAGQRRTVLVIRLVSTVLYLVAVLWAPVAFAACLVFASRGWLGPGALWFLTLVPTILLLGFAVMSRAGERFLAWSVRRDQHLRAAVETEVRSQVHEWKTRLDAVQKDQGIRLASDTRTRVFRLGAVGAALLALAVVIPAVTLAFTGAIGPVIASVAVPSFTSLQARLVAADMLRRHRLDPDPAVTAAEAGEALHSLVYVGAGEVEFGATEREPVRVYERDWFPAEGDTLVQPNRVQWALGLFERVSGSGMPRPEWAYLREVATNPAHQEFAIVGQAESADVIGTRFVLPLPDTLSPIALPLPRLAGLGTAALAHVAKAALEVAEGRTGRAERTVREVISLGFVLIDGGTTIIDNMTGARIVSTGGEALENLYRATGRHAEAEQLLWLRAGMKDVVERAVLPGAGLDLEGALKAMPEVVVDETVARGIRWEFLLMFASIAPCLDPYKVVFGPGEEYGAWLESARAALVRRPSDEQYFEFLQRGLLVGNAAPQPPGWISRLVELTFGGASGFSACAPGAVATSW
ncbi:MAG: hypothetical protein GTN62_12545 [Gemmatimonadales bacterium]|nr:hypothetical protein [Gemmatimonadales bacterium]NIN12551.1 hypothetical protein [Gemmatimonadales bacterium]NIN50922.1 hypothetical protein [Gemmatimonadales bacterium]NIP08386.1 hypothetical protein [Gemmatimonadales bacterium]NIQ99450.1 hypothetical protein [Gemmatimonadales bacterium]